MTMRFRSIKYYINEAFKSLVRNSLMSISSIATVSSCIFIIVFSYCIAVNIDYILEQFENSVGISAIIDDSLSNDEVNALYDELRGIEHVASVEYISANKALEEFAKSLGEASEILNGLENDNPLRRSFTISIDDVKNQAKVISRLKSPDMAKKGIAKVREATDVTDILIAISNVARIISVIIVLILGLLSVIIIMNTIKLTVNSRRNEIGIMKYVGATDWFIKWPFILEGVIIGIFGSFLPITAGFLGYDRAIELITNNFEFLTSIIEFKRGVDIFPPLAPFLVIIGALIGVIGSVNSMRKHLDV